MDLHEPDDHARESNVRGFAQLDLFAGPHIPRQRAIDALLESRPEAAIAALAEDDRSRRPDEWQALWDLAGALAEALRAAAARSGEAGSVTRKSWPLIASLPTTRLGWPESIVRTLRRSFHRRILEHVAKPLAPLLPDGTLSGWLVLGAGDPVAAIPLLEEVVRSGEPSGWTFACLADALFEAGRTVEAKDAYREALYVDPRGVQVAEIRDPDLRAFLGDEAEEIGPEWYLPRACMADVVPPGSPATRVAGLTAREGFAALAFRDVESLSTLDRARFFYRGMVLGRPGPAPPSDLGGIRSAMKAADAELFEEYMAQLRSRPALPLGSRRRSR
ncbi:MAG: hypothetical protein ACREQ9_07240 [Candidatus Binatia bacterium]